MLLWVAGLPPAVLVLKLQVMLLMVDDSRTPDAKATIPGAVNIPYAQNMAGQATDLPGVKKTLLELFGVKEIGGSYDFSATHTLAIFCNGPWCGQTPNYIRTLLALGYPAARLKWYRGGMQDWCSLGLTVFEQGVPACE